MGMSADRKPFHKRCLSCQMRGCRTDLTSRGIHKYEGSNICDKCHEEIYRKRTYGEGGETIEQRRKREEEEKLAREKQERMKRERRCPECEQKTFDGDSEMMAPDLYYHRGCIKCVVCTRQPDEESPMMMAPKDTDDFFAQEILEPFCRFCYAKKFKMSAIQIAQMVEIAPELGFGL